MGGKTCVCPVDIDECKSGNGTCGKNSVCVNALGSYACFCDVGFTGWDSRDGHHQCSGKLEACQEDRKFVGEPHL